MVCSPRNAASELHQGGRKDRGVDLTLIGAELMLLAYLGPETMMPVVSLIAAVFGLVVFIWRAWRICSRRVSRRAWTVDHGPSCQSVPALLSRLCRVARPSQSEKQHES